MVILRSKGARSMLVFVNNIMRVLLFHTNITIYVKGEREG